MFRILPFQQTSAPPPPGTAPNIAPTSTTSDEPTSTLTLKLPPPGAYTSGAPIAARGEFGSFLGIIKDQATRQTLEQALIAWQSLEGAADGRARLRDDPSAALRTLDRGQLSQLVKAMTAASGHGNAPAFPSLSLRSDKLEETRAIVTGILSGAELNTEGVTERIQGLVGQPHLTHEQLRVAVEVLQAQSPLATEAAQGMIRAFVRDVGQVTKRGPGDVVQEALEWTPSPNSRVRFAMIAAIKAAKEATGSPLGAILGVVHRRDPVSLRLSPGALLDPAQYPGATALQQARDSFSAMVEQARTTGDAAALRDLVENPTKVVEDLLATSLFKAFVPLEQLVPKLVGLADEKVPLDYREAFEVVRAALTTPRTDGRPRGTKPTENGAITHLQPTFSETVPAALTNLRELLRAADGRPALPATREFRDAVRALVQAWEEEAKALTPGRPPSEKELERIISALVTKTVDVGILANDPKQAPLNGFRHAMWEALPASKEFTSNVLLELMPLQLPKELLVRDGGKPLTLIQMLEADAALSPTSDLLVRAEQLVGAALAVPGNKARYESILNLALSKELNEAARLDHAGTRSPTKIFAAALAKMGIDPGATATVENFGKAIASLRADQGLSVELAMERFDKSADQLELQLLASVLAHRLSPGEGAS